jgi:hypothetical protein
MNIIGMDVSKAVEIQLGNFPDKWKQENTPGQAVAARASPHQLPGPAPPAVHNMDGGQKPWGTPPMFPP